VFNIYETIPPLDTTWYTIWAKVIVIVATYRRFVTTLVGKIPACLPCKASDGKIVPSPGRPTGNCAPGGLPAGKG